VNPLDRKRVELDPAAYGFNDRDVIDIEVIGQHVKFTVYSCTHLDERWIDRLTGTWAQHTVVKNPIYKDT
jgi:hypothetical protein